VRVLPHHNNTGGFFICLLKKVGPLPADFSTRKAGWHTRPAEVEVETEVKPPKDKTFKLPGELRSGNDEQAKPGEGTGEQSKEGETVPMANSHRAHEPRDGSAPTANTGVPKFHEAFCKEEFVYIISKFVIICILMLLTNFAYRR
jgi:hypothetical protein